MCKVCTGYHGTSEIEHGLCACTVDNPLAKARGLSLRTGANTMLYLSRVQVIFISELHNVVPTRKNKQRQPSVRSCKKEDGGYNGSHIS